MVCGLLGKTLSYSYSPRIHNCLGDYSYELFEKQPEELADAKWFHKDELPNTPQSIAIASAMIAKWRKDRA